MKVLVFDLKAPLAHFRRPDTTASYATYPIMPRTAIRGLVGSILGEEEFLKEAWIGLQLIKPVSVRAQELSMLGKGFLGGGGDSFNRPTSLELVINPHYRIYYHGAEQDELTKRIQDRRSHYHTYLGSAFALVVPEHIGEYHLEEIQPIDNEQVLSSTVVPSHIIGKLDILPNMEYGRVGGILYDYLGERRFRHSVHVIYEVKGKPMSFRYHAQENPARVRCFQWNNKEAICLW